MDMPFVLRVAGIVALVVAALFAVLAVHYYLTRDIRGVMDDLSGKTRARGVAGVRSSAALNRRRDATRRAAEPVPARAPVSTGRATGDVAGAWETASRASRLPAAESLAPDTAGTDAFAPTPDEEDAETMVEPADGAWGTAPHVATPDEDDAPTVVEVYGNSARATAAADEDDAPTMVESYEDSARAAVAPDEDDAPTMVEPAESASTLSTTPHAHFRVTRRVVLMSAGQVVAASEESSR